MVHPVISDALLRRISGVLPTLSMKPLRMFGMPAPEKGFAGIH
jgi:hypothetical protein